MMLVSFAHTGEDESDVKYKTGITGRRWALHLEKYSISFEQEIELLGGDWVYGSGYYTLFLTRYWGWGYENLGEYDGPHKCFSLGFLHFNWG